jgi:hypothetical protein
MITEPEDKSALSIPSLNRSILKIALFPTRFNCDLNVPRKNMINWKVECVWIHNFEILKKWTREAFDFVLKIILRE